MTSPATARTRRRPSCGLNIALPPEDSSRINAFSEREADKWVARGAAFFEPGPQTVRTMGGLRAEDREVFSVPTSPEEGRGERRLRVGVSVQVTGGEAAWLDLLPFRLLAAALRDRPRTARMKAAAGRRIHRVRDFAAQDDPLPPRRRMEGKRRGQERFRVGVERPGVDVRAP